jgi:hypothetical protein
MANAPGLLRYYVHVRNTWVLGQLCIYLKTDPLGASPQLQYV